VRSTKRARAADQRVELAPGLNIDPLPADLCPHVAGHLFHPAPSGALLLADRQSRLYSGSRWPTKGGCSRTRVDSLIPRSANGGKWALTLWLLLAIAVLLGILVPMLLNRFLF